MNAHEAALCLGAGEAALPGAGAGDDAWEPVRQQFAARGLERTIITLGARGSVVLDSQAPDGRRITRIRPTKVEALDTTGAGDAFTGAVAASLAAGRPLSEAAGVASVAAALATTRKGTQAAYPTAEDLRRMQASPARAAGHGC